jgi:hypothetical protein
LIFKLSLRRFFLICFILTSLAIQSAASFAAQETEVWKSNALAALATRNKAKADFCMARYLSVKKSTEDLKDYLVARKLSPAGFLPASYSQDFIHWFIEQSWSQWFVEEAQIREQYNTFELYSIGNENYFVSVVASPEIQAWFVTGAPTLETKLVAAASGSQKIMLYAGNKVAGKPSFPFPPVPLAIKKRAVQFIWQPEFYDIDKDGQPEVFVRYNLIENGFSQVLEIYKLTDTSFQLYKTFRSENEGFARRLGDTIEIGKAQASKSGLSRRELDEHLIETWKLVKGKFVKIKEKKVPNIFVSGQWKEYYN